MYSMHVLAVGHNICPSAQHIVLRHYNLKQPLEIYFFFFSYPENPQISLKLSVKLIISEVS